MEPMQDEFGEEWKARFRCSVIPVGEREREGITRCNFGCEKTRRRLQAVCILYRQRWKATPCEGCESRKPR
jgi:hypothetical protein